MNPIPIINPTSLTLLTTNQCTASCKNCCLNCSPNNSDRLTLTQMKQYIDYVVKNYPNIHNVFFTGGECFLLGKELKDMIQYSCSNKLLSRVVTNGFWATSYDYAKSILSELKALGLSEINFSTGDDHQEYVPILNVINGVIASIDLNLTTVVNIESGPGRLFSAKDFYEIDQLKSYLKKKEQNRKYLRVLNGMWMPFTEESMKDLKPFSSDLEKKIVSGRCTNLFSSLTISPNNRLLACCGLPMSNIKYLDLGNIKNYSIKELYENQFVDFLKIWLYVEGPYKILTFIADKIGQDNVPELSFYSHTCFYCAVLFTNNKYLSFLQKNYIDKYSTIMMRYLLLTQKLNRVC